MTLQSAMPVDRNVGRTMELLGGAQTFRETVTSRIEAHDVLEHGLPVGALNTLVQRFPFLLGSGNMMERAIGISVRTYQRRRDTAEKPLSPEQSSRAWKFAEIVARASEVLGSEDEAVVWMTKPAMGLDQRRPIDLIGTAAGLELVEDHLSRIEYGVYS